VVLEVVGGGDEVQEEAIDLWRVEEGQSIGTAMMSCLTGNTSFTFKISFGWRDSRMCSKVSEGSSDIETGYIANSMRVSPAGSARRF